MPRGVHDSPRSFNMIDMIGRTCGRLTVLSRAGTNRDRKALWLCKCTCGNTTTVSGRELRGGHTRSCGCLMIEEMQWQDLHGSKGTRLYMCWKDMHKRCHNPKVKGWQYWGGKGVAICADWNRFPPFRDWALTNGYRDDLTLDRIDGTKNYRPDNCRWATRTEQSQNRIYNGKRVTAHI